MTDESVPKAAAPEMRYMIMIWDLAAFMTDAPAIS
jgi:hypothetical protein